MANVGPLTLEAGCIFYDLNATQSFVVTDAAEGTVGSIACRLLPTGSGGTVAFKHRIRGSGLAAADWTTCLVYTDDSETVITAGTANSAGKIYIIPTDGSDLCIDYVESTGSMKLYIQKFKG